MTSLTAFYPKDETSVPSWPAPGPAPAWPERVYVIGATLSGGALQFYFVERPATPDPTNDGPLEIRVPNDCTIVLRLSPDCVWSFPDTNAVVLGPMNYADKPRYFNAQAVSVNGVCREVRFLAQYLDLGGGTNQDPYALYINLNQGPKAVTGAAPLLIRIDPDIDNPGGHN